MNREDQSLESRAKRIGLSAVGIAAAYFVAARPAVSGSSMQLITQWYL